MRSMAKAYQHLSDQQLRTRRSKALVKLKRAEAGKIPWNDRDIRVLEYTIHQIDVELNCRALQNKLPFE